MLHTANRVEFRGFLELTEPSLRRGDEMVALPPRAMALLLHLAKYPGQAVDRDELFRSVWPDAQVSDHAINTTVFALRTALKPYGRYIVETVPGVGYRFNPGAPVPRSILATKIGAGVLFIALGAIGVNSIYQPLPRIASIKSLTHDAMQKDGPLVWRPDALYYRYRTDPHGAVGVMKVSSNGQTASVSVPPGTAYTLTGFQHTPPSFFLWRLFNTERAIDVHSDRIAVAHGKEIAFLATAALPARKVTFPSPVSLPQWSPDGHLLRVVLTDEPKARTSLWDATPDGSIRPVYTSTWETRQISSGDWSSEQRYYIFSAGPSMDQRELWVRRERDGAITRLTQGTTNWKWPVSGARPGIFYAMGGVSRREIDEVDSESGGFQPRYGHRALAEVIYSRDGKKSAFVTYPERSLCLPGKNGEPDVRLTDNRFEVHGAHFSPDGRQIAFMSLMDGRARVSVIPTIGGTPRELLSSSEDQGIPTWSADGRFIVFGELLDRKDRNSMRIRRYDTVLNTVTDLPDSVGLWSPRWSPDGRFISAVSTDERQMRLFDVRESHWRVLASLGHFENQAWTPDSRYLLGVGSIAEKGPEVIRVRISNGKAEPVAEFGEGAFADWIGPTPDGSVLACRRVQMNDIYEIKLDLP